MAFTMDERLARDSAEITDLALCDVRLMNDMRFPWLLLVPRRENLREIIDLDVHRRTLLMDEIATASDVLKALFAPDKINVGALGNLVPQLHIHVIARHKTDAAWPGPVWGHEEALPYSDQHLKDTIAALKSAL